MKKLEHLSEIYKFYDTFVIDLWGVIHNGITLNDKAIEAVGNLLKDTKKIVFLSNAPRPNEKVREYLKKLKMEEKYLKNIITSGDAAMNAINENRFGKSFFHLGPSRDESIFDKIKDHPYLTIIGHACDKKIGCQMITGLGQQIELTAQGWQSFS